MVKKKKAVLALFLAFAVMLQYSFMSQPFEAYAGEITEASTTEEPVSSEPEPAAQTSEPAAPAEAAPAVSEPVSAPAEPAPAAQTSEPAASDNAAPANNDNAAPAEKSDAAPAEKSDAAPAEKSDAAPAEKSDAAPADNATPAPAPKVALKSTAASTGTKAADELTIKYNNVVFSGPKFNPDKVYPYSLTDSNPIVKGGSRNTKGFNNKCGNVGGGDISYGGVTYQRLNVVVLSKSDTEGVFWESLEGHEDEIIDRVYYDGNGQVRIKFQSGRIETRNDCTELTLSPVYHQKQNWLATFNYIDNISTGSGSWSNLDAVYEYRHTFRDPSEKSPSLTEGKYKFKYWQGIDVEDGEKYYAGDQLVYSEELNYNLYRPTGSREIVNISAFWQPAISVVYNILNDSETVSNVEGEDVTVYDKKAESTVDGVTFEGWYDADGNRISENEIYKAPGITNQDNTAVSYNVFARFATSRSVQKVWDDGDNVDGIRTGSVTVRLYANGEPTDRTITLSDANSWAAAFEDLDAYDTEGNLIEYTISEDAIPAGYSASISVDGTSFTVTNTHTPQPAPAGGGSDPNPADDDNDKPVSPAGGSNSGNTPAAGGGNGGGTTAAAGGPMGPTTITANPAPKAPATTAISDPDTPLAVNAYWALVNLLCAIATALLSVVMLIRYFGRRNEEDEETGEETEIRRKGAVRLASIIPAIGAIIAFILTEDMTNPMIMTDKWTIMMIVILAVQCIVAIAAKKKSDDTDGEMVAVNA